jgi:uncharacterized protein YggE
MRTNRRQISTAVVALLLIDAVLSSSTVFLALQASQPKPTSSVASGTSQSLDTLRLPSFKVMAASDQTDSDSSSANTITVDGTGEASYIPSEALIQVSVQTNSATAVDATSSNAQDVASVIAALNGIGISNSSIQTQGYTLSVNYADCDSSCVPQITGYTVTNSLQVNITSSSPTKLGLEAGQVIDTAVKAGANGISLSFGASNSVLSQLTDEALQNAVASADSQAKAIASSLGVSISGVISASESGGYSNGYTPYETILPAAVTTPIVPGTQSVSATVQVIYSIS